MIEKVRKHHYITFVGPPGSGKSATVRHIALLLQKDRYEILPITDKNKLEDYCDTENPQVFVIDDVFGVFGVKEPERDLLCRYRELCENPPMPDTKILMTCREEVYRDEAFSNSFLSTDDKIIFLSSAEYPLTEQDKHNLLAKYNIDRALLSSINLSETSAMFPYLCKLFVQEKFRAYGSNFFICPIPCILEELDGMKTEINKIPYASLILLMANQNKLSEEDFDNKDATQDNFTSIKREILKKLKIDGTKESFHFCDALSKLEGTFTQKSDMQFTFIHSFMMELIAYHCRDAFKKLILDCMSSEYIATYVKFGTKRLSRTTKIVEKLYRPIRVHIGNATRNAIVESKSVIDLSINLSEDDCKIFAARLFKDLENFEHYNIFGNDALKDPSVARSFVSEVGKLPDDEIYTLFFSNLETRSKRDIDNFENDCIYEFLSRFQNYVSTVHFVVLYGHHQILEYLLDNFKKNYVEIVFEELSKLSFKSSVQSATSVKNTSCDSMTAVQCHLLRLGCYSGDLDTVNILLRHISKDAIKMISPTDDFEILREIPILIASRLGYTDIVMKLVKEGADVNVSDHSYTPLVHACMTENSSLVEQLIQTGANINQRVERTPLTAACITGNLDIFNMLIKEGALPEIPDTNYNTLEAACIGGNLSIIEQLLKPETDVNRKHRNQTPLTLACENKRLEVVKKLISLGARVNLQDGNDSTPLGYALDQNDLSVVEELVKNKANVDQPSKGNIPLIRASSLGHLNIVKKLIEMNADVNIKHNQFTPLHAACAEGHLHVVELLINSKANFNLCIEDKTPFTIACDRGDLDVVKALIKAKADINPSDNKATPLIAACKSEHFCSLEEIIKSHTGEFECIQLSAKYISGHFSVVEGLMHSFSKVSLPHQNQNIGQVSCCSIYLDIVIALIKSNADVNLSDGKQTPLTAACQRGRLNIVKKLIEEKADVNLSDGNKTPLIAACCSGRVENEDVHLERFGLSKDDILSVDCERSKVRFDIVMTLLDAGASVNLKVKEKSPLRAANDIRDMHIVDVLKERGAV